MINGNLKVAVDPTSGFVTATRLSDNKVILQQTALKFSAPFNSLLGTPLAGVS